jgi:hypothetical protein
VQKWNRHLAFVDDAFIELEHRFSDDWRATLTFNRSRTMIEQKLSSRYRRASDTGWAPDGQPLFRRPRDQQQRARHPCHRLLLKLTRCNQANTGRFIDKNIGARFRRPAQFHADRQIQLLTRSQRNFQRYLKRVPFLRLFNGRPQNPAIFPSHLTPPAKPAIMRTILNN